MNYRNLVGWVIVLCLATIIASASTTHYAYNTPTVGGSQNTWGTSLNSIFNSIDTNIWQASGGTNVALSTTSTAVNFTLTNPLNSINNVTITTTGKAVSLPPMNATSSPVAGGVFMVNNTGSNAFAIDANDGSTSVVSSLGGGQSVILEALTNSTTNGTFQAFGPYLTSVSGSVNFGASVSATNPSTSAANTGLYSTTSSSFGASILGTTIGTWTSTGLNGMAIGATTSAAGTFTTVTGANAAISGTTTTANLHVTGTCTGCGTAGIGKVTVQSFCASGCTHTSGTWTPTSGTTYIIVRECGGGGGGGGVSSAPQYAEGGSGAAGSYSEGVYPSATFGSSQTITLGAGGLAGSTTGGNAGNGGTSSIGALLTAPGGGGGQGTINTGTSAPPGTSGSAGTGGYLNVGGNIAPFGFAVNTTASVGAPGANSPFGAGGVAVSGSAGNNGTGYCSGGSGASVVSSGTGVAGGAGSPGIVIITEYQ